jgi:hypothetical protein
VFQEGRQPHGEGLRQFLDRSGTLRQAADDGSPGGIGKGVEGGVEGRLMVLHTENHRQKYPIWQTKSMAKTVLGRFVPKLHTVGGANGLTPAPDCRLSAVTCTLAACIVSAITHPTHKKSAGNVPAIGDAEAG